VKNRRPHTVYLPPLATQILAAVPQIENKAGYVFTANGRTPVSGWSHAKAELDAAMLALAKQEGVTSIAPFRTHDLRRSAVTYMSEIGVLPHVVEAVVNHLSGHKGGIAGVYNRSELRAEKTQALERLAVHVEAIVAGKPANVLTMRRR
jgi:integrase